jgi:hypothetical protein
VLEPLPVDLQRKRSRLTPAASSGGSTLTTTLAGVTLGSDEYATHAAARQLALDRERVAGHGAQLRGESGRKGLGGA